MPTQAGYLLAVKDNESGLQRDFVYLLDTKPLPVVGYTRRKDRSDFAATADYGVCTSHNLKYFGYKLVLICTPTGVPAAYDLVPASTNERIAGEQVLDWVWQARILGDKDFIGANWQQSYRETRDPEILTSARTKLHPLTDILVLSVRASVAPTVS